MFVQPFFLIFANRSLPGSQRKIRKFFMKMSAEIILFSVSILFNVQRYYQSWIEPKFLTLVAYSVRHSLVKVLISWNPRFNSRRVHDSHFFDERITCCCFLGNHTYRFFFSWIPPVGGGNFVSLIRKKLILKNKKFCCVDGVRSTSEPSRPNCQRGYTQFENEMSTQD